MNEPIIFSTLIDELDAVLTEGARADYRNTDLFVEPVQGTLTRSKTKRHHLIFGRRGSGKSSLLIKSVKDLTELNIPVSYIDLEPFKGHTHPDVLLSIMIVIFTKVNTWLKNDAVVKPKRCQFRKYWFYWKESKKRKKLSTQIISYTKELSGELEIGGSTKFTQKISEIQNKTKKDSRILRTSSKGSQDFESEKKGGSINVEISGALEREVAQSRDSSVSREKLAEYSRSKKEYLISKIMDFREIFEKLTTLYKNDYFLFLDDLYHLKREDQPELIDYLHRIFKGNRSWLKIGTIKTRSTVYKHTPQPLGLKIGDDADEINLDQTLEKFLTTKDFLKTVLQKYLDKISGPDIDEFVTDGGLDRLVLSSGGVARDFLGLFRKSILEARERLRRNKNHSRGQKIGAEDVNVASGDYGDIKKEEFQRDTIEDTKKLEESFEIIKEFCLEKIKKNIFLVEMDTTSENKELFEELIDLRLIHQVKSRVTTKSKPGKVFKAYLLDVSQYTGERARRDVEMMDFWKDSVKDRLRNVGLIFNTDLLVKEEQAVIEELEITDEQESESSEESSNLL